MLGKFRNDNEINIRNTSNLKFDNVYEIAERDDFDGVRVFIDNVVSDWYHWTSFEWLCEHYGTVLKCIHPVDSLMKNEKYFVWDDGVDTFSVKDKRGNVKGTYSKDRFIIIEEHISSHVQQNYIGYR